ncbi:hypothetical protein CCAX7_64010 [Capsulimonas corticalis]|uniref:IPT/TIG domain-containing protein n=1 Tax=Capsulimonas corticalis TaxID=2219043 RepID=A0A9N7LEG4_9BACT|nr:IPT/TIG domain-containing protein [Capsulimonas corticalis]BDI34350.1 hypothetical protein CCAX7_64010 [Capsulimonas corticalis]
MIRNKRNFSLAARALCAIGVTCLAGVAVSPQAHAIGTWQSCPAHQGEDLSGIFLLTDGTVLASGYGSGVGGLHWYKYTPDAKGDYTKGTWSNLADSPWGALYFVSFTLNDGRFWMAGGEYVTFPDGQAERNNHVQIFDPIANTWTQEPNGLFGDIGDTAAVLLNDGRPMVSYRFDVLNQIYNLDTNTWTQTGNSLRGNGDESTWQTLADGTVFDCRSNPAERYNPATGQWIPSADCPIAISTNAFGAEQGPITYLQNGQLWCASDNGPTALFNPPSTMNGLGSWSQAATYPAGDTAGDTPAAIETNGKVLLVGSDVQGTDIFGPGNYYEYDPATNAYTIIPNPPAGRAGQAFTTRLLELPTGQILYTSGGDLAVYTPEAGTGPDDSWRPTVSSVTRNNDGSYTLTGTQITGRSFGANYGDDFFNSTNFPIVYLKDASNNVYFCRTSDFSTRAIWTGSTPETCKFQVPNGLPAGKYDLYLSVNGVSTKKAYPFPPAPLLTTVSPSTVAIGTPSAVLTLTGDFFLPTATVTFNGGAPVTPISVTTTQITVAVPSSVINTTGIYAVRVHDTNQASDSSPSSFIVATPSITGIVPNVVAPGTTGLSITIAGTSFESNSKVAFNGGTPVTPTSVTPTTISVSVPDALLTQAATVAVTVVNTATPGGTSPPGMLYVAGVPTLTSITPSSTGVGASSVTLTLKGSGFSPSALVSFNDANYFPTSATTTQMTVAVPANVLSTLGTYSVKVVNPGAGDVSSALNFQVLSPTIASLSPAIANVSASGFSITINGHNFVDNSKVTFSSGDPVSPTSVTPTQIVVPVPLPIAQAPGTAQVVVVNAPGAGGSTSALTLTVVGHPTLTLLSPSVLKKDSSNTLITLTGTNFYPGASVTFNDTASVPANVISATQATALVPSSLTGTVGAYFLRLVNVGTNNYSNPARYTVVTPVPAITSLSPSRIPAGLASQTLYVYGSNFTSSSQVTFNGGAPVTPSSMLSNRIIVSVPASVLANVGDVAVRVVNSVADGGSSAPSTLSIAARPVLTSIAPTAVPAAATVTLTLTGANFEPSSVVTVNDTYTVTPTVVSSTKLTLVLPSAVSSTVGSYFARVVNTGYANTSGTMRFSVVSATVPAPTITSLNPTRVPAGLSSLSLYVYGTGFTNNSAVSFNGGANVAPSSVTSTRIVVPVPPSALASAGDVSVRVVNITSEGGPSGASVLSVASRPVLTSVSPSSIVSGSTVTLTYTGSNFEASSVVTVNDTYTVTPTIISSTQLTVVLPSAVSSAAGSYFTRVVNTGYSNYSGAVRITVTPAP